MTLVHYDEPDAGAVERRAFQLGAREQRLTDLRQRNPKSARFTAAARLITTANAGAEAARIKRQTGAGSWHADAWMYYDAVELVKEGGRFRGRNMSKLHLFPAVQLSANTDPVPLDTINPDTNEPYVTNQAVVNAAIDVNERLAGTRGTGHLTGGWGINGFVTGDAYLVGYTEADGDECFVLVASDNLRVDERNQFALALSPEAKSNEWIPLPDATSTIIRIWNAHAAWPELSDSAIHGVLPLLEQILVHTWETVAQGYSHMNAGVWAVPTGVLATEAQHPDEHTQVAQTGGSQHRNPTARDIVNQWLDPVLDPRSQAGIVPSIMEVDPELLALMKDGYIKFDRPYDALADSRLDKAITRYANGVDLPKGVVLGLDDATHWNAAMIDDQTYRQYIEPDSREFVTAVTQGYSRPMVAAYFPTMDMSTPIGTAPNGQPLTLRNLWTWMDASSLVGDPDEVDNAFKGVEMGLLGNAPARAKIGWSESEKPTDEDIALRLALTRGREAVGPGGAPIPTTPTDPTQPAEPAPGAGTDEQSPTAPGEATTAAAGMRLATRRRKLARLGPAWAARDAQLLTRVLHQADAAMVRALDRAGAKLRTKALKAAGYGKVVQNVPNRDVGSVLGPGVVAAALDVSTDDLFDGAFDDLIARFNSQVGRAQEQTLRELEQLGLPEDQVEQLRTAQRDHRDAAAVVLLAALLVLAKDRVFSPHPEAPAAGEHNVELSVPTSMIRTALAQAGGAQGRTTPGGTVRVPQASLRNEVTGRTVFGAGIDGDIELGGVSAGADTLIGLDPTGANVTGLQWDYGDPSSRTTPFEPHLELDGMVFTGPDDPDLYNDGDPVTDGPLYFPGDHAGCECQWVLGLEDTTVEGEPAA